VKRPHVMEESQKRSGRHCSCLVDRRFDETLDVMAVFKKMKGCRSVGDIN